MTGEIFFLNKRARQARNSAKDRLKIELLIKIGNGVIVFWRTSRALRS